MWWDRDSRERYWVEIRWVDGIGSELRCSKLDNRGKRNGWYDLVTRVRPADFVYHWNAIEHRFVGRSIVSAFVQLDGDDRTVPLEAFRPIRTAVNLDAIRTNQQLIVDLRDRLKAQHPGEALYLPFQFRADGLRMMSNYFAKMPKELVRPLFGDNGLADDEASAPPSEEGPEEKPTSKFCGGFLKPFKPKADTYYQSAIRGGVQRRGRHHETLVNEFAQWLTVRGYAVGCNAAIDLGISKPAVVIEAKIVGKSWAHAIRTAIGQLYEYRYFQVVDKASSLVLLVDRTVPSEWQEYLEDDRKIGVIARHDGGWEMSELAKRLLA